VRKEEARVIGEAIQTHCLGGTIRYALNLGSGDVEHLLQKKPWIQEHVFARLQSVGCKVIHADLDFMPGVNEAVDLTDVESVSKLATRYVGSKVVLLCNVLEHIPKEMFEPLIRGVTALVSHNDYLVVSVPRDYPFHPDPIDTMFRPTPSEIIGLFSNLEVLESGVVQSGSYRDDLASMGLPKKVRRLLRPILPVASVRRYLSDVHRLTYIHRPYKVSYVMFRGV
jgi:hypothetical protein